ncbi:MAG: hypothetical protein ACI8ZF_000196 [Candidatus Midichloriaceae bacterium]|jgi:hypothetical protein
MDFLWNLLYLSVVGSRMAAVILYNRGKSGLHGIIELDNTQRRELQGKCSRKYTAYIFR